MTGSQYETLRDAGLASDSATEKQVEAINSLGPIEFEVLYNSLKKVKEAMIKAGIDVDNIKADFIL